MYHFPDKGIFIYASTEQILLKALKKLSFTLGKSVRIHLYSGDMLRIDQFGNINRSTFDDSKIYPFFGGWTSWPAYDPVRLPYSRDDAYIEDLKAVAASSGLFPEDVDELLADGVSP